MSCKKASHYASLAQRLICKLCEYSKLVLSMEPETICLLSGGKVTVRMSLPYPIKVFLVMTVLKLRRWIMLPYKEEKQSLLA